LPRPQLLLEGGRVEHPGAIAAHAIAMFDVGETAPATAHAFGAFVEVIELNLLVGTA